MIEIHDIVHNEDQSDLAIHEDDILIRFPKIFVLLAIGLFALSLTQDCYYTNENIRSGLEGWELLLIGWLGIFYGYFTWLANPVLLICWIAVVKKRFYFGLILATGSLLIMLSFLFYKSIVTSEAPTYLKIFGYGLGYWLWVASAGCSIIANLCGRIIKLTD